MSLSAAEAVARAVLYEGFLLYPYRATSLKNQRRWTLGGLFPRGWDEGEASALGCECLLEGQAETETEVEVRVRFLHLVAAHEPGAMAGGQEAVERELQVTLGADALVREAEFAADALSPGRSQVPVRLRLEARRTALGDGLFRLALRLENLTPLPPGADRAAAQERALASPHVLLRVRAGAFVSLLEPPEERRLAVEGCRQEGAWPVLVGAPGARDTVLASPIILYDYPAVAPESPGDLFDATEIDEILSLRILTLSEAEKAELRAAGGPARALLERTEALGPEALLALHGARRGEGGR